MADVVVLCAAEDGSVTRVVQTLSVDRVIVAPMGALVGAGARSDLRFGGHLQFVVMWGAAEAAHGLGETFANAIEDGRRAVIVRAPGVALPADLRRLNLREVAFGYDADFEAALREAVTSVAAGMASRAADRAHTLAVMEARRRRAHRAGVGAGMAAGLAVFGVGGLTQTALTGQTIDANALVADAGDTVRFAMNRVSPILVAPAWAMSSKPAISVEIAALDAPPLAVTPTGSFEAVQVVSVAPVSADVGQGQVLMVERIARDAEALLSRNRAAAEAAVARVGALAAAGADVPLAAPVKLAAAHAPQATPLAGPVQSEIASVMVAEALIPTGIRDVLAPEAGLSGHTRTLSN